MPDSEGRGEGLREPFRIVFVCTGNTCRSPMAEAIARDRLARRGWTHVEVTSAGTFGAAGAPAADDAIEVAREHGMDLTGHRSRALDAGELARADLILGMTLSHVQRALEMGAGERVALLGVLATGEERSVPDPIGQGLATYRETWSVLSAWIDAALTRLEPLLSP
ncbi:MAG: low molecular weight protein arginine phosphatase [Gemmatimonadota bacterium]